MKTSVVQQAEIDRLHNLTCLLPHSKEPRLYAYDLDGQFIDVCIFLAVFNFLTFIPSILLNSVILAGLLQEEKLRIGSNLSLFSICIADILIGVLVQPIFAAHLVQVTKSDHVCSLSNFLIYIIPILVVVTMVTHMVISLERYCAVRYREYYTKIFAAQKVMWTWIIIWVVCLSCYVVPFATGDQVLGTRIVVCLILISLGISFFCYISIYQKNKWKHGRPVAEIQGAYVISRTEPSNITPEEEEELNENVRISVGYFKLYICMLTFYLIYLIKNTLNGYDTFKGNSQYLVQFGIDTLLFLNALINPCVILHFNKDIKHAVLPIQCQ